MRASPRGRVPRLLKGPALAAASVLLTLGALEIALRVAFPFTTPHWPSVHRRFGFAFRPGATVRWTNMRDFCVEQRANSLGFLDREPPERFDPAEHRILVLGDSFVEAAQVPPSRKTTTLLEERLSKARPGRRFRVNALGYSGAGTGDALAFYDQFGERFRPDTVVIVFVSNDFANNTQLLEAVRNGLDPAHLPRPYFTPAGGGFRRVPADNAWLEHRMRTIGPAPAAGTAPPAGAAARLLGFSTAYAWARARLSGPAPDGERLHAERVSWLRGDDAYREALSGWEYPADEGIDTMFFAKEMPPLFDGAVAVTGHILDEFRARAGRDGFRLLLVAADNLSGTPPLRKRRLLADGPLVRLRRLAGERGLAVLDLGAYFRARRGQGPTCFPHDGHWNATGHRLASEAIGDYLVAHAETYLRRGEPGGSGIMAQ